MKSSSKFSRPNQLLEQLKRELSSLADPTRAQTMARYFKTGRGEYGEGDRFLGIPVPAQRKVAVRYRTLPLKEIEELLRSSIHEHRFTGLEILVAQYGRSGEEQQEEIFRFYLAHTKCINNWDLVDTSASYIVGNYLLSRDREVLKSLATSTNVWERRIAIVATFAFLRRGEVKDTLHIAMTLLSDTHDLIHKAIGWALREVGKVDRSQLLRFLQKYYQRIPRTTLRYAIEHFTAEERKDLLKGDFQLF